MAKYGQTGRFSIHDYTVANGWERDEISLGYNPDTTYSMSYTVTDKNGREIKPSTVEDAQTIVDQYEEGGPFYYYYNDHVVQVGS